MVVVVVVVMAMSTRRATTSQDDRDALLREVCHYLPDHCLVRPPAPSAPFPT